MSVRIHLDNPHAFYTNLDFISGKIILSLPREETISTIVVKLEGESKTTLVRPPPARGEPPRGSTSDVLVENHKILYKLNQVFPPGATQNANGGGISAASNPLEAASNALNSLGGLGGTSYTLRAGQHEYPFNFKIPFNNMCLNQQTQGMALGFGGLKLMDLPQQLQYRHIKNTLPPSLSGFPGEAEIRYYIKVTVNRPSIWKENRRSQVGFKFLPIEPPRPTKTQAETFARRSHTFSAGLSGFPIKKSIFGKRKSVTLSDTPPQVLVDARLPNPAILTCNVPMPLRILVKKQNETPEMVFLVGLQIDLIGYTTVRAFDVQRVETGTWVVVTLMGLNKPIGEAGDKVGTETLLDSSLWEHVKLPHTVTPSFNACNLTRTYELEVKVTLGFGYPGDIQPQTQTLPLRFPVEVFSGIAPPAALLDAMASRPPQPQTASPQTQASNPILPPRPQTNTTATTAHDPLYPPQLSATGVTGDEDAPPPSYEDAMADDIAPVNGRREYSGVTNENAPSEVDEKGRPGGGARKGDSLATGGRIAGEGSGSGNGNTGARASGSTAGRTGGHVV